MEEGPEYHTTSDTSDTRELTSDTELEILYPSHWPQAANCVQLLQKKSHKNITFEDMKYFANVEWKVTESFEIQPHCKTGTL